MRAFRICLGTTIACLVAAGCAAKEDDAPVDDDELREAFLLPPLSQYTASSAITDATMGAFALRPPDASDDESAPSVMAFSGGEQCIGDCLYDNAGRMQCAQVYSGAHGTTPPAAQHWRTSCQNILQWIADDNLSIDNIWVCNRTWDAVYQPATNDYIYTWVEHCSPRKVFKEAVHITLYQTGSEQQTLGNFMNPGPAKTGMPQYCESQQLNFMRSQSTSTCGEPEVWTYGGTLRECNLAGRAVPAWSKMTGAKSSKHPADASNDGVMCVANMTWAIGGGIAGGYAGGVAGVLATLGGVVASLPSCLAWVKSGSSGGAYWAPVGQDGAIPVPGEDVIGRTTLAVHEGMSMMPGTYGSRNIEFKACHRKVHHEWGWHINAYACPYVVNDQGDASTIEPSCSDDDRNSGAVTSWSTHAYFTLHEKTESEHTEKCKCRYEFTYGLEPADCSKIGMAGDVAATITSDTFKACNPPPPPTGGGSGSGSGMYP